MCPRVAAKTKQMFTMISDHKLAMISRFVERNFNSVIRNEILTRPRIWLYIALLM
jgi:hypothetical protein